MPRVDRVAFGEDHRALDAVLQLAHVAGPRDSVISSSIGRRRQRQRLLVQVAAEPIDEVLRQHRDVVWRDRAAAES